MCICYLNTFQWSKQVVTGYLKGGNIAFRQIVRSKQISSQFVMGAARLNIGDITFFYILVILKCFRYREAFWSKYHKHLSMITTYVLLDFNNIKYCVKQWLWSSAIPKRVLFRALSDIYLTLFMTEAPII